MDTKQKNALRFFGVATGLTGVILIASRAAGAGGGNGNGGNKLAFDFGAPTASGSPFPPGPGWTMLTFDCRVSNPHDVIVQRTLTIYYRMVVPGYPELNTDWTELYQPGYSSVVTVLDPLETVYYHYSGADHYEQGCFLMQQQSIYYFQLRDDLGNASVEASVQT